MLLGFTEQCQYYFNVCCGCAFSVYILHPRQLLIGLLAFIQNSGQLEWQDYVSAHIGMGVAMIKEKPHHPYHMNDFQRTILDSARQYEKIFYHNLSYEYSSNITENLLATKLVGYISINATVNTTIRFTMQLKYATPMMVNISFTKCKHNISLVLDLVYLMPFREACSSFRAKKMLQCHAGHYGIQQILFLYIFQP